MGRQFAKWYDFFMYPLERRTFKEIRSDLLTRAYGKVIELGSGTGVNFPLYQSVESVTAVEPSSYMIERSEVNKELAVIPIEIIQASAEQLPFEKDSYDTVVATLAFCTIPDVDKAFEEMKRICKPNGKILLFEHVKMDNPILAKLQIYLTPFWKKICDGCHLDRDTVNLLKSKGFQIVEIKKFYRGLFVMIEIKNI
jgi:ubiquinone/menaquinone biosynthesis C-methylase UbiE